MRRKIRALRTLFERSAGEGPCVRLADGRIPQPISSALAGKGTTIRRAAVGVDAEGNGESRQSQSILDDQARHELDVYGKRGLALVWGLGSLVRDADGREYIDCIGGHGALALGHRHPAQVAALRDQSERIWFVPGSYGSPPRARLLERLHAALPVELEHTFLSNSGTEAMEAALKIARAHTGRENFVAAVRGFHGRTFGALSVTAEPRYREPFGSLLGEVRRVPFNQSDALAAAVDETVAAVILEVVQGEGGVHIADPEFLHAARDVCDRTGALLVFDEVQTGFGRTGRMFAFEHSGVMPDVLCLAKSIAGGLPLGATTVRHGIELPMGSHGSTFGGNPIACAVAAATLDALHEGDLLADVDRKGARLASRLREASPSTVREVRQVGLMIGIQLRGRVRSYLSALQEGGVLALAAGTTVLRLLPPLIITDPELERVAEAALEVLAQEDR
jgi:acetylornithine/LysW-gamma-L-lysine aminotransferase